MSSAPLIGVSASLHDFGDYGGVGVHRPVLLAGDELELNLVKEGRDAHQAVGYLPDGTMIVVNQARSHIGRAVNVVVSSALQTAGGRLIFAELKENARTRTPVEAL